MSTNKLQTQIEFLFKGGVKAEQSLEKLETKFKQLSKAAGVNTEKVNKNNDALNKLSDQGMFNIQAGMVQLSTYSMIMNQKVNNAFEKMGNSFKKAENSLTQLKIKMGLTLGDTSSKNYENFGLMEKEVKRLAATTKFTIPEVADAFNKLVGTGLKAKDAIKALGPTLQFVSASAGAIDLSQGVEAAKLSTTTLNGELKDLDTNLNMIFKATQKTSLSFENVTETFTGLKSSFASFKKDKDLPLALVGLSSAMASVGMVGREGGDKINQFSGALGNMFKLTERGEFMGFSRKNVNRKNMLRFFGLSDSSGRVSIDTVKELIDKSSGKAKKALNRFYNRTWMKGKKRKQNVSDFVTLPKGTQVQKMVESYRDETMKNLLTAKGEDGKRGLKSATDLMGIILKHYEKAVKKEGDGVVSSYIASALGGAKGTKLVLEALKKQMDKSGADSFAKYLDVLRARGDELSEAQKLALDTVEGQTKLLESAYDSMFQSLMGKDVFGKDALKIHRDLISTLDIMLQKYPSLAQTIVGLGRAFQVFTGVATNLGFALTAMATLSMGLTYATKQTGRSMKGLGNILGSFRTIFLAPTLSVLMSLVGGFALVSVGIIALMQHFTGAKSIGEGFSKTMEIISTKIKGITGLFKLSMHKDFEGQSAQQIADQYKVAQQKLTLFQLKNKGKLTEAQVAELAKLEGGVNKFKEAMGGQEVFKKFINNTDTALDNLAGITDTLLEFKGTFMSLFGGLIKGLTPFVGMMVYFIDRLGMALNFVIRGITTFFGYMGDSEGNTGAGIVGWMLGAFLGIKFTITIMSGLVSTLVGGFVGMGNAISRAKGFMTDFNNIANKPITTQTYGYTYKDVKLNRNKNLPIGGAVPNMSFPTAEAAQDALNDRSNRKTSRRRMEIAMVAGQSHQATFLERQALRYYKITRNVEGYDRVLERARGRVAATNAQLTNQVGLWTRIKGGASVAGGAIMKNKGAMTAGIGGGLAILQMLPMLGGFFGEGVQSILNDVGMLAMALGMLWPIIGGLVVGFLAVAWPFMLIAGIVAGIYYYWEGIVDIIKKVGSFVGFDSVSVSPKDNKPRTLAASSSRRPVIQNNTINQTNTINTESGDVSQNILDSLRSTAPRFQAMPSESFV